MQSHSRLNAHDGGDSFLLRTYLPIISESNTSKYEDTSY